MTTKAKRKKAMTLEQFFKALISRGRSSGIAGKGSQQGLTMENYPHSCCRCHRNCDCGYSHVDCVACEACNQDLAWRLANAADGDSSRPRSRLLKHWSIAMHNYDYKTKITVADLERRFNKGYGKYDPSCYGAPDCFVNAKTKEGQA